MAEQEDRALHCRCLAGLSAIHRAVCRTKDAASYRRVSKDDPLKIIGVDVPFVERVTQQKGRSRQVWQSLGGAEFRDQGVKIGRSVFGLEESQIRHTVIFGKFTPTLTVR